LQIIDRIKESDFSSLQVASPEVAPLGVASSQVASLGVAPSGVAVRIGLHCGPVTAGVLGKERLQYDVWGDTVNVASRMESTGEPNRIHVSETFANALSPTNFDLTPPTTSAPLSPARGEGGELTRVHFSLRGTTEIKGKGPLTTFWLTRY